MKNFVDTVFLFCLDFAFLTITDQKQKSVSSGMEDTRAAVWILRK